MLQCSDCKILQRNHCKIYTAATVKCDTVANAATVTNLCLSQCLTLSPSYVSEHMRLTGCEIPKLI